MTTTEPNLRSERRGGQLARSQRARRERVIDAVLALASEGGYEAVQLRSVADRADVAVRTIYSYYGSRDELLRAAMLEWQVEFFEESITRIRGTRPVDRVLSLFRYYYEVFEQDPHRLEAYMRVQQTPAMEEIERRGEAIIGPALRIELEAFDEAFAEDFTMILDNVIYASLSRCASGRLAITEVWTDVERTIRRLIGDAGN